MLIFERPIFFSEYQKKITQRGNPKRPCDLAQTCLALLRISTCPIWYFLKGGSLFSSLLMICQLYLLMFLKSRMLRLHDMRKRLAVSEVSEEPNKTLLFRKAASHTATISLLQVKSSMFSDVVHFALSRSRVLGWASVRRSECRFMKPLYQKSSGGWTLTVCKCNL